MNLVQRKMKNPKCPKCNKPLRLSKIVRDKWICKETNEIFDTKDINVKGTWYDAVGRPYMRY